jgi:hypothetical protein
LSRALLRFRFAGWPRFRAFVQLGHFGRHIHLVIFRMVRSRVFLRRRQLERAVLELHDVADVDEIMQVCGERLFALRAFRIFRRNVAENPLREFRALDAGLLADGGKDRADALAKRLLAGE